MSASSSGAFPASRSTWSPACPGLPSWASLKQISHGLSGLSASGSRHHQPFASHTRLSLTEAGEPRDHPASCQLHSHTFSRGDLWVITSCPEAMVSNSLLLQGTHTQQILKLRGRPGSSWIIPCRSQQTPLPAAPRDPNASRLEGETRKQCKDRQLSHTAPQRIL